jgi:hypothetical protein
LQSYSDVNAFLDGELAAPASWTEPEVSAWLLSHVRDICSDTSITPDGNLFEQGLDRFAFLISWNRSSLTGLPSLV